MTIEENLQILPELPPEIWLMILSYLSTKDLGHVVKTSKKLHDLLMSNKEIWMIALKKEGKYLDAYQYFPLSSILPYLNSRMIPSLFLPGCYK